MEEQTVDRMDQWKLKFYIQIYSCLVFGLLLEFFFLLLLAFFVYV